MMAWTDDPVRDAERYEEERKLADRECLHCAICGGVIWDGDDYFDIDDMVYCEDCAISSFRRVAMYD